MNPKFNILLKIFLGLLLLVVLFNYRLINYGFGQLKGQLHIICNAVAVDEVLANPSTSDSIRTKLILAQEIRNYSMDSLGLHDSKNYTTFFDQQNKPIMWVVTGCLPYELTAKEWWFPVLGNVSYKGYFVEEKAKLEENKIKEEGYETDIYSPSAWSTLGFFTDPILSNMLKRSEGRLAELIIHELTHATIYLTSSVDFNENFATFIGEEGAKKYLASKYGNESVELKKYQRFLADEEVYNVYMLNASKHLDSLYKSFTPNTTEKQKALMKKSAITEIVNGIAKLPLSYPERYSYGADKPLPNNTEFMAFLRYRKSQEDFRKIFAENYNSNLKLFLKAVVDDPEILSDPKK
jgi:predicted aminopeptidase